MPAFDFDEGLIRAVHQKCVSYNPVKIKWVINQLVCFPAFHTEDPVLNHKGNIEPLITSRSQYIGASGNTGSQHLPLISVSRGHHVRHHGVIRGVDEEKAREPHVHVAACNVNGVVVVPLGSAPREAHRVEKNSGIKREVSGRELIARITIRAGGRMPTVVVNYGFYWFSWR